MILIAQIQANSKDLDKVVQLFKEYAAELNEDLCFQSFNKELENPLTKYGANDEALLLAYYNNIAVGCVAITNITNTTSSHSTQNIIDSNVKTCEMKRLYVQPEYRKYGIGKKLVQAIMQKAILYNYALIKLDTLQKLQPAITLYTSFGFKITNAYYKNPLPNVVYMQKWLS